MFGAPHDTWDIFETERCLVREIKLSDLPALFKLYEKPGVTDYLEPLYEWDEEVEYIRSYIENIYGFYGYGMWVVINRETGELMGRVGFDDRTDRENGRILELGFLIDPELQRRGYALEVCTAAISYAFKELDEETVTCLIMPGNEASIALVEKLGFEYTGRTTAGGKDMMRFDLKRSIWYTLEHSL